MLAKKMFGFRYLMDVIPLEATLVRGTHGRVTGRPWDGRMFISSEPRVAEGLIAPRAGATRSCRNHCAEIFTT
jgi:hypothetical protein